jgi:hypothetical protein
MISEQMKRALMTALLRSAGLPSVDEIDNMIKNIKSSVEIILSAREDSSHTNEAIGLAEELFKVAREKVNITLTSEKTWPKGYPEPLWSIGGRLGHRFKLYGYPTDLLGQAFRLAVAVAGKGWNPPIDDKCCNVKGKALLYAVPGLPCTRAIYYSLHVLVAAPEAELTVINIESMASQGLETPVKNVPTFITPRGKSIVLTPRSVKDVLRIWTS